MGIRPFLLGLFPRPHFVFSCAYCLPSFFPYICYFKHFMHLLTYLSTCSFVHSLIAILCSCSCHSKTFPFCLGLGELSTHNF